MNLLGKIFTFAILFTAIVVTRALLGVVSSRGFHLSAGMMGVSKDEIGKREK